MYLESCRNLDEGRQYVQQMGGCRRLFFQTISPVPLLELDQEGKIVYNALQWLEANCRKGPLNEASILSYHRMLFPKAQVKAGTYRSGNISVKNSKVPRPPGQKIPALMKQLDLKLQQEQRRLDTLKPPDSSDVLKIAVGIHQRLAFIHPFEDGNGRVARLAMNHLLRRYGHGYVILPPLSESPGHFETLENAHMGKLDALVDFARNYVQNV